MLISHINQNYTQLNQTRANTQVTCENAEPYINMQVCQVAKHRADTPHPNMVHTMLRHISANMVHVMLRRISADMGMLPYGYGAFGE